MSDIQDDFAQAAEEYAARIRARREAEATDPAIRYKRNAEAMGEHLARILQQRNDDNNNI